MKDKKIANINVRIKDLFLQWLKITYMYHRLSPSIMETLALLLYYHYEYKKVISNQNLLWKMVFDYDTKMKIKEELGIKDTSFQNRLSDLRKAGIIVDNKIIPTYIPNIDLNSKNFQIIYNLNIVRDE